MLFPFCFMLYALCFMLFAFCFLLFAFFFFFFFDHKKSKSNLKRKPRFEETQEREKKNWPLQQSSLCSRPRVDIAGKIFILFYFYNLLGVPLMSLFSIFFFFFFLFFVLSSTKPNEPIRHLFKKKKKTTKFNDTELNNPNRNRTKQNKTKQNKTKQNSNHWH